MREYRLSIEEAQSVMAEKTPTRYHYCAHLQHGYCVAPSVTPAGARRPPDVPEIAPVEKYTSPSGAWDYWYWIRGRCPHQGWEHQKRCFWSIPSRDA